jgi:hypothetical protein
LQENRRGQTDSWVTHRDQSLVIDESRGRINQVDVALNIGRNCRVLVSESKISQVEDPSAIAIRSDRETLGIICIDVRC